MCVCVFRRVLCSGTLIRSTVGVDLTCSGLPSERCREHRQHSAGNLLPDEMSDEFLRLSFSSFVRKQVARHWFGKRLETWSVVICLRLMKGWESRSLLFLERLFPVCNLRQERRTALQAQICRVKTRIKLQVKGGRLLIGYWKGRASVLRQSFTILPGKWCRSVFARSN